MSNPVFFVEPAKLNHSLIRIDGDEGRHAAIVKRLRIGEPVDVCDGLGNRARGLVSEVSRDFVNVDVQDVIHEPVGDVTFSCVQALAKGDRAELALEILTEVGISNVYPWQAQHSIAKWDSLKSQTKWQRVVREASKQARRSRIPEVHNLQATSQVSDVIRESQLAVVLHETAELSIADIVLPQMGTVTIVVGPEGGLTQVELETFRATGAQIVHMGPTIMRTSTAGGIALGILASKTTQWC